MLLLSAAPGIPLLGPSGASAHLRGVAAALRPRAVVCARAADHRGAFGQVEVPVVEVGVPGWPSWASSWRDYREVWTARRVAVAARRLTPTLVWERHSLYSDAGWKLQAELGCRWILEVNAPLVEERLRFEEVRRLTWARAWERDVLLAAPEIVAVSRWLCAWLTSLGCRNVRHLPNGVVPQAGARAATRARLQLGDTPVLGFLGSMKPWHGAELLPRLLDCLPSWRGLLVGDGPVQVQHPRLLQTGHVSEREAANLVAAMDVALAPYGADAPPWFCPLKLLHYRAQGTPVVAPDLGDCRELTGDAGVVLPREADLDTWVDAVSQLAGRRFPPYVRSWDDVVREGLRDSPRELGSPPHHLP